MTVDGDTLLNIQSTKLCTLGGAELVDGMLVSSTKLCTLDVGGASIVDGKLVSVTEVAGLKLNVGC